MPNEPAKADLSVAISASIDDFAAGQVMTVNKALLDHYGTRYIVNKAFPPHLSLLLSGTAASAVPVLKQVVCDSAKRWKVMTTTAVRIDLDATGFLRMECSANNDLLAVHRELVEAFRVIHEKDPRKRESDFSRWTELQLEDGKIVRDNFKPHLSLGWVDPDNGLAALTIAESILNIPFPVELRTLDLVEVGPVNQVWNVMTSEPLARG